MMQRQILLLFSIIICTVWVTACNSQTQTDVGDTVALELGETVYINNCASCHGVNLEGEPDWRTPNPDGTFKAPPHDATGHTWHHGDTHLLDRIRNGTANLPTQVQSSSNMPAYADVLTDAEIEAVLTYIKSSWPDDIRESQAAATAAEP